MNVIKSKFHNNQGASMLIALVYLLTALMVGTVVLTAASSNVGRITHNRQEQREYYAVESAAELVKTDMAEEKFTAAYSETKLYDWIEPTYEPAGDPSGTLVSEGHYILSDTTHQHDSDLTDGGFLQAQKADFDKNYFSSANYSAVSDRYSAPQGMSYDLSFSAKKSGATLSEIPEVNGKLTVNQSTYDITVELWAVSADDASVKSNPITMRFEANVKESKRQSGSKSSGSITETYEMKVVWLEPELTKGVVS